MQVTFVENDAALSQICGLAARAKYLALDTECIREKTYYPRPALVQIAVEDEVALIDPTAAADLAPLRRLLADPEVLKIIHCAQQDFEVLERIHCPLRAPVFDTQLAAAFVGLGHQTGYKQLVMQCLGAELEKDCSRSDWLQRPLSEKQKRYAVNDVIHLRPLHETLLGKLRRQQKELWFAEESERYLQMSGRRGNDDAWRRVGGSGKLRRGAQKRRLELLAEWRDRKARAADLPRRWLLGDDCLIAIALLQTPTAAAIEKLKVCRSRRIGQWAREMETLLAPVRDDDGDGGDGNGGGAAARGGDRAGDAARQQLMKDLLELVRETAHNHGIEPALLATRKQLTQLVRTARAGTTGGETTGGARETTPLLNGWRGRLFAGRIEALLDKP